MTKAEAKKKLNVNLRRFCISLLVVITLTAVLFLTYKTAYATSTGISININGIENPDTRVQALDILFLLTILSLAPSILIMMTSFTRIVIVLSLVRNATGLASTPPNQIIIGLALFLTLYIMSPVVSEIKTTAYEPYVAGQMTQKEAVAAGLKPMKVFMLKQINNGDLSTFMSIAGRPMPENKDELLEKVGLDVIIPAFITSELKRAFTMGFLLFIPFLVIDIVVSSVLMSMGMIMLPPVMISLPFKIMLFVLVDGWGLLVKTLISSFNR
ncbi:MAG TPA: flagellar biosynthetic protein FliP [Ruminococcaceae bacterium]|nr:flagellar biosynthetic protein FliP [Oscillospiraceae bacterium]